MIILFPLFFESSRQPQLHYVVIQVKFEFKCVRGIPRSWKCKLKTCQFDCLQRALTIKDKWHLLGRTTHLDGNGLVMGMTKSVSETEARNLIEAVRMRR